MSALKFLLLLDIRMQWKAHTDAVESSCMDIWFSFLFANPFAIDDDDENYDINDTKV